MKGIEKARERMKNSKGKREKELSVKTLILIQLLNNYKKLSDEKKLSIE